MSTGWYPEEAVVERLQLTRSRIDAFRRSLEKTAWKKEGREVLLSPGAVKQLLTELGFPDYDISNSAIQGNGKKPPAEVVDLVIERVFPNPRLLLAKTEAGDLVRVAVPMNVNFLPHMKIRARPPIHEGGLYRLEGRVPRYRGHW